MCFQIPFAPLQPGGVLAEMKLMATNPRWVDRQAYVQICGAFVGVVDRGVVDELLPLLLMMVDDHVPNVRCELAKVRRCRFSPG